MFVFDNIWTIFFNFFFRFNSLGQEDTWSLSRVETIILEAASNLPVEQTCLSYLALEKMMDNLLKVNEDRHPPDPVYVDFIKRLLKAVENRLIQRVGMATKCPAWDAIPKPKQISIMQMGFFNPIDSKYSSDKRNPTNVRRNHSLNAATATGDPIPNTRAPRVAAEPFQRTTLRSTVHSGRNPNISRTVDRTPATSSSSGIGSVQQQSNRRVPAAVSINRSQSARTPNVGTTRTTTSRPNINQVDVSSQRSVNSTVPRTASNR